MLTEREHRELREIEQTIVEAGPRLAAIARGHPTRPRWASWMGVPGALVVLLCANLSAPVVLGLLVHALVVLVMVAWPFVVLRTCRRVRRDVRRR